MKTALLVGVAIMVTAACCQESVEAPLQNIFTTTDSSAMYANIGRLTFAQAINAAGRGPDSIAPHPTLGVSIESYEAVWNAEHKIVRLIFDRQGVLENYHISAITGEGMWK